MKKRARILAACLALGLWASQPASALPEGWSVQNGQVTITGSGQTMTIQQVGQKAIVNWNGFSIGAGELVKFIQPNQLAAILNRVTGVDPSVIDGVMQANGSVFLINPNGVLIGPGGMVNVGSFVASTLDVSNADFLKGTAAQSLTGSMAFKSMPGKPAAAIVNQGTIKVRDDGFVVLMAPSLGTSGAILARSGQVKLGAGNEGTVNFDGGELINFTFKALEGTGTVVMSQADANNVLAQAVNNLGIEEAGSLSASGDVSGNVEFVAQQAAIEFDQTSRTAGEVLEGRVENGDLAIGEWYALDGGSIDIDVINGNLTFDTLVAEQALVEGQLVGGVVDLNVTGSTSSSSGGSETFQTFSTGNITSTGEGIAADLVLLNASGNISTAVAANTVRATAGGNVNLSLRPGVIDGDLPSPSPTSSPTPPPNTGDSPSPPNTSTSGSGSSSVLNESGSTQVFGTSGGSSSHSSSSPSPDQSSSSQLVREGQVFGTSPGSSYNGGYSPSPSPSPDPSPSPSPGNTAETPGNTALLQGSVLQQGGSGTVGTPVGVNGTVVSIQAGGDVELDSVNTVIVEQISGRNVNVRSQTGSVVDNGDSLGADNRDIIASQSASLSARDFLGTVDDPLEVEIGGDLTVFAQNEVDGISGVLVGDVFGDYIQNSQTAGIVLLNPGTSQADGIPQAIHGIMDNNGLPGDTTIGGASLTNLFFLRLLNSIDEDDWLEILRGSVVWEDSDEEASEEDL